MSTPTQEDVLTAALQPPVAQLGKREPNVEDVLVREYFGKGLGKTAWDEGKESTKGGVFAVRWS